jgi:hypothetical protein
MALMFDMTECLERAAYCARLAEAETDPQLRHLFKTLASQWMQVSQETEEKAADTLGEVAPPFRSSTGS